LRPFTADFNGDGNLDLVTGFISVGSTRAGSRIAVLLGLGDGTFGAVHTFGSGSAIATDDFDGDGKPDLVAVNAGNVNLLLGNGDGTFQAPVSFTAGTNPSFAAVADLDGDKAPDLVVANSGDNRVSVFLNTGIDFSISASPLSPPTLSPGQSATSTVTLSLLNAFDNPVALACSVQPSGSGAPTCAMNPSSVSFDSNGKATATLTVNTGAAVTLVPPSFLRRQRLYPFHFVWLPIAGIAVWGTGFGSRRYRRRLVLTIGVSVLLAGLLLQAGCGGDNGSQNGASQTFNIAVNATSGTTAHSATVNLRVK
jgi:hypothetical protein